MARIYCNYSTIWKSSIIYLIKVKQEDKWVLVGIDYFTSEFQQEY